MSAARNAESGNSIQIDSAGSIYIAGQTTSPDFFTMNAAQSQFGGIEDAFVMKLASSGSLVYSTYIGGAGSDQANGLAVLNGEAYVAGATDSWNFPTVNAIQRSNQGGQDAFVTKLNSSGSGLVYSTYWGGSAGFEESAYGIAVTPFGEAVVTGTTASSNFPLTAPLRSALTGVGNDAFLTKLDATGTTVLFSTLFGGSSHDAARGITLDASGRIYVAGETRSNDIQVADPIQASNVGTYNAFIAVFSPKGSSVQFSSYWGGGGSDSALGIAVDSKFQPVIVGSSTSWNLPLLTPLQPHNSGNFGGFITRLSELPLLSLRVGTYLTGHWGLSFNASDFWFGIPGDVPVVGDWSGSGTAKIGIYRGGQWLIDYNGNRAWDGFTVDRAFWFGLPGDRPVVGDWDASGRHKIGIYRDGQWFVDYNGNNNWDGVPGDRSFWFGLPGDIPVIGDWDGSGRLKIGVYRAGQWFLDYNGNYAWDGFEVDRSIWFGLPGDIPVVGDWDGTGRMRIGVYRAGQWLLDLNGNFQWDGEGVDASYSFGSSADTPVATKW